MKHWREPYHTCSIDKITTRYDRCDSFHHSGFKEGVLDGGTSSRFQETHLHGPTLWQIPKDIFQSKLDAIFIGMEGVTGIADDMVIAGRDEMEHDRNFLAFMEKCMSNNLTLNAKKIQFKQSQVSSMDTAGQNKGFHQIQRRLRLCIMWNSHQTRKL